MAFAAIHPEAGRIDATQPDLGCGLSWAVVHRTRPRVALRCPDCGHGVHAKVSTRKLRYFAHDPGRPADCVWLNESLEHHLLKLELATGIRAAGWHADLEVRADDGSWRADVLASSHDGNDWMAWEAQLSPITDEDIRERTARYAADGIDVCWVSPAERSVPWINAVPSIRVRDPLEDQPWTVTDGVAAFDYPHGTWLAVENLALEVFIRSVLHAQVSTHVVLPRYRRIWFAAEKRYARRQLIWTTASHIEAEARHEVMRQRQEARRRQREEEERQAEEGRRREAEAQRQEQARQREIDAAAARVAADERHRQWLAEYERAQQLREAEEQRRRAEEHAAEQERLRVEREQVEAEMQVARQWWAEVSGTQLLELREAVAAPVWKDHATKVHFDPQPTTSAEYGYGIAVFLRHRLYGILRPAPASLHRIPAKVPVFVRNAREAAVLIATEHIDPARVVHFDLPDHEQMSLI